MRPPIGAHSVTRFTVQGIIIVLFFKCMSTLLNPVRRSGRGIRWGLMGHTVAMFSLATIYTAVFFHLQSFSYIDNREFPGFPDGPPAGPFGYQFYISNEGIVIVYGTMFQLNQWLADGLLVSTGSNPVVQLSNVGRSPSSIAAMFFLLRTTGSLHSHA